LLDILTRPIIATKEKGNISKARLIFSYFQLKLELLAVCIGQIGAAPLWCLTGWSETR